MICGLAEHEVALFKGVLSTNRDATLLVTPEEFNWPSYQFFKAIHLEKRSRVATYQKGLDVLSCLASVMTVPINHMDEDVTEAKRLALEEWQRQKADATTGYKKSCSDRRV